MASVSGIRRRTSLLRLGRRGRLAGYFFVAPSLIFLFVFLILPIFAAFYYSLSDYDLMSAPRFAGLKNYRLLLDDSRFHRSITNTLFFAAVTVPAGALISLLLALLIDRRIRGIYAFRAAFYMPVVSSFVAVSLIWLWFYEPQIGFFNELLEALGLPRLKWLRDARTSMLSIILVSVWKNMGLNMVIYLAGLQGIPPHLHEAAQVDGAGKYSRFFRITLPLLAPTTYFVLVVYVIGALQLFVQIYVMTQTAGGGGSVPASGGPLDSTITVVVLIFDNAFSYLKFGIAAAMSFVFDPAPNLPSLISRIFSGYGPNWGGLQTRWV